VRIDALAGDNDDSSENGDAASDEAPAPAE
jgi:hypothetical protein